MKKDHLLLSSLLCLIGLTGCAYEDPALPVDNYDSNLNIIELPRLRTAAEAIQIANDAIGMLDDVPQPKSRREGRHLDVYNGIHVIKSDIRGRSEESDTLMYVINYADNLGFAMVSALRNTPELIAVTTDGSYDPSNPSDNPGFNFYINEIKEGLTIASRESTSAPLNPKDSLLVIKPFDPLLPVIREKTVVDTIWHHKVPIRVKNHWQQSAHPENVDCPNGVVGCGPLATAMAMTAFEYPQTMQLTYGDQRWIELRWSELKKHRAFYLDEYECRETPEYAPHQIIAQLCRDLGNRAKATYYYDGSGTGVKIDKIYDCIYHLGFKGSKLYSSMRKWAIAQTLNINNVCLIAGYNTYDETKGHMWLCDAVKHFTVRRTHYTKQNDFSDWEVASVYYDPEVAYNFFNWGWSGNYCGYYLDLTCIPNSMNQYGTKNNPSGNMTNADYSKNMKMIRMQR